MKIIRFFFLAFAASIPPTVEATSATPPNSFISMDNMIANADTIAIVEITAGELRASRVPEATYHITVTRSISGAIVAGTCINGPRGLRIGSRYLLFIEAANVRKSTSAADCSDGGTIGDRIPRAMEITTAPTGDKFVKLDNERIAYPKLAGSRPVAQELIEDDKKSTLTIGTWAPLDGVVEYIMEEIKKSK